MESESLTAPETDVNRKRDKIRSAWISFVGRIAAQIIGAIATVVLGVAVLNSHDAAHASKVSETPATSSSVLVATPVRTEKETIIVVLPVDAVARLSKSDLERVAKAATDFSQTGEPVVVRRSSNE